METLMTRAPALISLLGVLVGAWIVRRSENNKALPAVAAVDHALGVHIDATCLGDERRARDALRPWQWPHDAQHGGTRLLARKHR